mmetsp:Transcript_29583/g.70966  ORF Transcript_29583/g.70966 Transcript_29583/m.70966 type:complete len:222 (-) Transcript_29583:2584-3249(-)
MGGPLSIQLRQTTGKSKARTQDLACLVWKSSVQTASNQQAVASRLQLYPLLHHFLHHLHGSWELTIVHASLNKIRVDMHVGPQSVLLGKLVHKVEREIYLPRPVHELDHNRQSKIGWSDTILLHLPEHLLTLIDQPILSASVQQRVIHDFIRLQIGVSLHLLQNSKRHLHVSSLAVTLEHRRISDQIRLDSRLLHVFQQPRNSVHASSPSASVHQCVVCDN